MCVVLRCPKALLCRSCTCTFMERIEKATGGYLPNTVDMEFLSRIACKDFRNKTPSALRLELRLPAKGIPEGK